MRGEDDFHLQTVRQDQLEIIGIERVKDRKKMRLKDWSVGLHRMGLLLFLLFLTGAVFLGGCMGKKRESAQVSKGQQDNVKGFLLIFDNRSAQQKLVRDMDEGLIPTRLVCEPIEMTWVENKKSTKKKAMKGDKGKDQEEDNDLETEPETSTDLEDRETESDDGGGDVDTDNELVDRDMVLVEKVIKKRVYTTSDEKQIRDIYKAMTEMIVVGQTEDQNSEKKCRMTYYLQDGTESVFEFDSVGLIKIGGQEYVLESDGSFWKLLPDMF